MTNLTREQITQNQMEEYYKRIEKGAYIDALNLAKIMKKEKELGWYTSYDYKVENPNKYGEFLEIHQIWQNRNFKAKNGIEYIYRAPSNPCDDGYMKYYYY